MKEKKAILVVSFGTSHADTREKTIGAIERDIAEAYPQYAVRRAFTSGMILKVLSRRDGIHVDTVSQALARLVADGIEEVHIQPTHVINGEEFDDMVADVAGYEDRFAKTTIGAPLLTSTEDYRRVAEAVIEQVPDLGERDALVLMGHGTVHHVNAVYPALDYHFKEKGYTNVFVGTVEGYPDIEVVRKAVEAFAPDRVLLLPLMVVAGDHAVNDMAGEEEDSWKSVFTEDGYATSCILKGLGEFPSIRQIYLDHLAEAIGQHEEQDKESECSVC